MDTKLEKSLDFSNYKKAFAVNREVLKEKLESKLIYGFAGGIFRIDQNLLTFVQMMIDQDRKTGVPIIDSNGNPILIADLLKFQGEIFDRYFEATLDYFHEFNKIKKSRTVEKLVDYE